MDTNKKGDIVVENIISPDSNKDKLLPITYLDILILICLKYISGQAPEKISKSFHSENESLEANACEFMEFILYYLYISNVGREIIKNVIRLIFDPIINILS